MCGQTRLSWFGKKTLHTSFDAIKYKKKTVSYFLLPSAYFTYKSMLETESKERTWPVQRYRELIQLIVSIAQSKAVSPHSNSDILLIKILRIFAL